MRRRNLTLLLSSLVIVIAVLGFVPSLLLTASGTSISVDTQSSSIKLMATLRSAMFNRMFQAAPGTSLIQQQAASIISGYIAGGAADWTQAINQLTAGPNQLDPGCVPYNVSEPMVLTSKDFDALSRTLVSPDDVSSLSKAYTTAIFEYYICLALYQKIAMYGYDFGSCIQPFQIPSNLADIYQQLPSNPLPISLNLEGYLVNVDLHLNNKSPLRIINVTATAGGQRVVTSFHEMSCAPMCSFNLTMTLPALLMSAGSIPLTLSVNTETPFGWGVPPVWFQTFTVLQTSEVHLLVTPSNGTINLVNQP